METREQCRLRVLFHYCVTGFSNCYLVGAEDGPVPREALLIDPARMDADVLRMIEGRDYTLRAVLITHDHRRHIQGLNAIMRVYNPEVYAVNSVINGVKTHPVKDGDEFTTGPFRVEVIAVPGHSADSAVFKIDRFLFTGDALTAGLVGDSVSAYGAALQTSVLRSRVFSLPGDYAVLPGHGPPTSLEAERRFNEGMRGAVVKKTW